MLLRSAFLAVFVLLFAPLATSAPIVPADFMVENAYPGTAFNSPVGIAFTPDGRMLVAEKRGVVRVVQNGIKLPAPMWDAQAEVLQSGDRGLLGIAVDPEYAINHFVYFLYTVDPDSNGLENNDDAFGRLTRYRTAEHDSNVVDPVSRTVLIGATWSEGIPQASSSHAVGALRWGADKSLLVSAGEGSQYHYPDAGGHDSLLFVAGRVDPAQDIGGFRAQFLGSPGGKILRIDPDTGNGYASNPYHDGDPRSTRSKVWAYGLRNPYRFVVRPDTGDPDPTRGSPGALYIGDTGWNDWEEIDIADRPGQNFGWPCFEGPEPQSRYATVTPAHHGCGTMGTPENPEMHTPPVIAQCRRDTNLSIPPGLQGRCTVGGAFYEGRAYPPRYRNRYFFGEFQAGWIKVATFDAAHRLVSLEPFAEAAEGPVDFVTDPTTGDLIYVAIYRGLVNRIRYIGPVQENGRPTAVARATANSGFTPLTVSFASECPLDPDRDPITLTWSFGDGSTARGESATHVYAAPGVYRAMLVADDGHGGVDRDTIEIRVRSESGFPSTQVLDDFDRADGPLASPWAGNIGGLSLRSGALVPTTFSSYGVIAPTVFGADQEAFATFEAASDSGEQNVLLKVQGTSWQDGHLQVHYDHRAGGVLVLTYDRAIGWRRIGGPFAVHLEAGDQLGARAYADGVVDLFRNGTRIATTSAAGWIHAASGGRVGLMLVGAGGVRVEAFGGGTYYGGPAPQAIVRAPSAGHRHFAAGDTIALAGDGIDGLDPAIAVAARWEVDLVSRDHAFPSFHASEFGVTSFVASEIAAGFWLRARLIVRDVRGRADTTAVDLFPEVDLQPSVVTVSPTEPGTISPAEFTFHIENRGRMPAAASRWRLLTGDLVLAARDTVVSARSDVAVTAVVAPVLPPGRHDLRVEVDSRDDLPETDESNNVQVRWLDVVQGAGVLDVEPPPATLAVGEAFPNPSPGAVAMTLELPHEGDVRLAVFDVQGRVVWRMPQRRLPAGRWSLAWSGAGPARERVRPGIYMARVVAGGRTFTRRITLID